jgi:hypothetical protein
VSAGEREEGEKGERRKKKGMRWQLTGGAGRSAARARDALAGGRCCVLAGRKQKWAGIEVAAHDKGLRGFLLNLLLFSIQI